MGDLIRRNPLFSGRRLILCLAVTILVVVTDVLFIQLKDVQTAADFVTEVTIYTLGFYGGLTITALFNHSTDDQ